MNKGIHWCQNCRVPVVNEVCSCGNTAKYFAEDIKPVFPKEKTLFEEALGISLPDNLFRNTRNVNRVILNGETLFIFKIGENKIRPVKTKNFDKIKSAVLTSMFDKNFQKRLMKANKPFLLEREKEAINFIKKTHKKYKNREVQISFSSGKDSALTAFLSKKAIGAKNIFFVDTTIEFPETVEYAKRFAKKYDFKLKTVSPPRDFFELCEKLGPPSRMMRWCCTSQKASAINEFYRDNKSNILCFLGIRSKESKARSAYGRVHQNSKISRQVNAYPIMDWLDFEVWLYAMFRNIKLNPVYQWGYSRIGCWTCPNNSKMDILLTKRSHPNLWKKWENLLKKYAGNNGRDGEWISGGNWKLRRTRYMDEVEVEGSYHTKCNKVSYVFNTPLTTDLDHFLKPFGKLIKSNGSARIISGKDTYMNWENGNNKVQIELLNGMKKRTVNLIEKQITKYLNCVRCGGCTGSCLNSAISVDGRFKIDEEKCTNCLSCCTTKHIEKSCVAIHYASARGRVKSSTYC